MRVQALKLAASLSLALCATSYLYSRHQPSSLETNTDPKHLHRKSPRSEKKKTRLPDAIIIGVKKSGTMTLGKKVSSDSLTRVKKFFLSFFSGE